MGGALLIAALLALAGCGQKGPLYLPTKPKTKVPAATSAPPTVSPSVAPQSAAPPSQAPSPIGPQPPAPAPAPAGR
ncbi:MAG: LPS translocon maturation chaperone LptM [Steroidobacteraceae bacterium]